MSTFRFYKQFDIKDCGPSCLKMISKHYGKDYSLQFLRNKSYVTREGVSLLGISEAGNYIGFKTKCVKISLDYLKEDAKLPCIVHWDSNHFVVVYKTKINKIYVADPAYGRIKYNKEQFLKHWAEAGDEEGFALLLEPTEEFYTKKEGSIKKTNFRFLFSYLKPYRKLFLQLLLGMLLGSLFQLIFPFLTQAIVDKGINGKNIGFLQLVLFGQFVLIVSRALVEFIRGWILLNISTRINITLVYDFLVKLIKLPVSFFDSKMIGDLLQRIGDHQRVESFLTTALLSIFLTIINLIIFSIILVIYNVNIFLIFLAGSILYLIWIRVFLKKRREIDFNRFSQMSENQNKIIQLVRGMQEIKLNACEKKKLRNWAKTQESLFKISIRSLALSQNQQSGSVLINESKNIFITFLAATAVIHNDITLGMMLAIQYILGQLNSPIEQMVNFIFYAQDAKISLERIGEIHQSPDEESLEEEKISIIPKDKNINISDLSFQYAGPHSEKVLKNIKLSIPDKKITAIVGTSGSGKTTLLKLLLGFYQPTNGVIKIGDIPMTEIKNSSWREKCGIVMQDGYIFSDTIAENIALKDDIIDDNKLKQSTIIANINEFIESLPLGNNTKIGADGHGLSQGQKQRILIARAVYKNPDYIFFDEATNSLDANNESIIMNNLNRFFEGKTVVIVAHRLSTVRNADQIIVIDKGEIVETGTHTELTNLKGNYYNLVKNQLELGK